MMTDEGSSCRLNTACSFCIVSVVVVMVVLKIMSVKVVMRVRRGANGIRRRGRQTTKMIEMVKLARRYRSASRAGPYRHLPRRSSRCYLHRGGIGRESGCSGCSSGDSGVGNGSGEAHGERSGCFAVQSWIVADLVRILKNCLTLA